MLRGLERWALHSLLILIRKKKHLVTLALVSSKQNRQSRAQTSIFAIEHQHFLSRWLLRPVGHQTCQLTAWKPGVLSQESSALSPAPSARIPQPGVLSRDLRHESSARNLQPGVLSQESAARTPQPILLSKGFLSKDSSARSAQLGVLSQSHQSGVLNQESSAEKLQPRVLS